MKRITILIGIFLTAFLFLACALKSATTEKSPLPEIQKPQSVAGEDWEMKWEKALSAANRENMIAVYTSQGPTVREELSRAVMKKFGIKLDFVVGTTSEIVNKVSTERRNGLYLADAFIIGHTTLINELKPLDILEPIEPKLFLPEVIDPNLWLGGKGFFIDKDKNVIGMLAIFFRSLIRNTELVREEEIKSFEDLLKPQYKGKMIMRDPTVSGTGNSWVYFLVKIWGLEKAKDYLRRFSLQQPVITRDQRLIMESVAHGKYPVGVGMGGDTVVEFINLGAPVAIVRTVHGGIVTPGGGSLGLPSKQAHPNTTIIFINWLLSREGQATFVRGYGQPSARLDISKEGLHPSVFPQPGEPIYMSDEESVILQGQLIVVAKEIFGSLLK